MPAFCVVGEDGAFSLDFSVVGCPTNRQMHMMTVLCLLPQQLLGLCDVSATKRAGTRRQRQRQRQRQLRNLVLATLASAGKWKKAIDLSAPMRSEKGGGGAGAGAGAASFASGRGGGGRGRERGGGRGSGDVAASGAVKSVAKGLAADAETYTHLIVACGKGGEPDRCVRGAGFSVRKTAPTS